MTEEEIAELNFLESLEDQDLTLIRMCTSVDIGESFLGTYEGDIPRGDIEEMVRGCSAVISVIEKYSVKGMVEH